MKRPSCRQLAEQLQTVLNADVAALDLWFKSQESNVLGIAGDPEVERAVGQLTSQAEGVPRDQIRLEKPPSRSKNAARR